MYPNYFINLLAQILQCILPNICDNAPYLIEMTLGILTNKVYCNKLESDVGCILTCVHSNRTVHYLTYTRLGSAEKNHSMHFKAFGEACRCLLRV